MRHKITENISTGSILSEVSKPGRYIGNEFNVIHKDMEKVDIRFLLAFPEIYEIGMSSQATGILYHLLNQIEYVWAERVFAPWPDMEAELINHNLPLYALESFSPAHEFDIIGFSLQYELTYTNILNMLHLSGITLKSANRKENEPVILAGGPCAGNPEPLSAFIDAFFIGDAEDALTEICAVVRDAQSEGIPRNEVLLRLSRIRGIYVPSLFEPHYNKSGSFTGTFPVVSDVPSKVLSRIVPQLKNEYYSEKPLVPLIEITHDRLAVEVMRGCTEGCRFCNAGMIYRPTRERYDDEIVEYSLQAIENSGYDELSFLSLSISDYSALNSLMHKEREALESKKVNVSFPSMRLDSFTENIAAFASSVRKSGFTFAPEAGSRRLRQVINKNITDDDLLKAVEIALENGWKLLKFYFMIGLPTETKEDIIAIGDLIERVVRFGKKYGRIKYNISISPHSPKSHTPFQWENQDTIEEFNKKVAVLRHKLSGLREVNLTWRDPYVSQLECILGRGDRKLADVIYQAWENGAKFDGWNEFFNYEIWKKAFNSQHIDMHQYLTGFDISDMLPWDHIDRGISKDFLLKERENAYNCITTGDCKSGTCHVCGIQRKNKFADYAECYSDSKTKNNRKYERSNPKDSLHNPVSKKEDKKRIHKRLRFEKTGFIRFISHLDVIRLFDRAFRRAGITVVFSEGFNPRPKFSFAQPLPLGFSSESEYVDVELYDTAGYPIREKLNDVLPDGIKILEEKDIPSGQGSLSSTINLTEYIIDLNNSKISDNAIAQLLSKNEIPIERITKGKTRRINLRPHIESIKKQNKTLCIRLNTINGRSAKIPEVLTQLNGFKSKHYSIHRKAQFIKNDDIIKTPLDIS